MLKQVEIPFNVQKSQGKLVSENMRSSATTKQYGLVSSVDYNLKQSLTTIITLLNVFQDICVGRSCPVVFQSE